LFLERMAREEVRFFGSVMKGSPNQIGLVRLQSDTTVCGMQWRGHGVDALQTLAIRIAARSEVGEQVESKHHSVIAFISNGTWNVFLNVFENSFNSDS